MAQERTNREHAQFAAAQGMDAPIVVFDNTNVILPRSEVREPRSLRDVQVALRRRGTDLDQFDVLMIIDLNPRAPEGGRGFPEQRALYVGNTGHWTTLLTELEWGWIAATAYHHELGHVWGWDHDWSACESRGAFSSFITAPALFGWTDTDGDGVIEINDPTPYGRSRLP
jgi:hypothetical protein